LLDQVLEDEVGGTCGTYGRERKIYKVLVGKGREETTRKTEA
jgi:hypothetical protein